MRALLAFLLALIQTLQSFVDAHGEEFDHRILHAQAALNSFTTGASAVNCISM